MTTLASLLQSTLGDAVQGISQAFDETTLTVSADRYLQACEQLRDAPGLRFDTLVDLCGMDYRDYREGAHEGPTTIWLRWPRSRACGRPPTCMSALPSICSALCLKATMTCGES